MFSKIDSCDSMPYLQDDLVLGLNWALAGWHINF